MLSYICWQVLVSLSAWKQISFFFSPPNYFFKRLLKENSSFFFVKPGPYVHIYWCVNGSYPAEVLELVQLITTVCSRDATSVMKMIHDCNAFPWGNCKSFISCFCHWPTEVNVQKQHIFILLIISAFLKWFNQITKHVGQCGPHKHNVKRAISQQLNPAMSSTGVQQSVYWEYTHLFYFVFLLCFVILYMDKHESCDSIIRINVKYYKCM